MGCRALNVYHATAYRRVKVAFRPPTPTTTLSAWSITLAAAGIQIVPVVFCFCYCCCCDSSKHDWNQKWIRLLSNSSLSNNFCWCKRKGEEGEVEEESGKSNHAPASKGCMQMMPVISVVRRGENFHTERTGRRALVCVYAMCILMNFPSHQWFNKSEKRDEEANVASGEGRRLQYKLIQPNLSKLSCLWKVLQMQTMYRLSLIDIKAWPGFFSICFDSNVMDKRENVYRFQWDTIHVIFSTSTMSVLCPRLFVNRHLARFLPCLHRWTCLFANLYSSSLMNTRTTDRWSERGLSVIFPSSPLWRTYVKCISCWSVFHSRLHADVRHNWEAWDWISTKGITNVQGVSLVRALRAIWIHAWS